MGKILDEMLKALSSNQNTTLEKAIEGVAKEEVSIRKSLEDMDNLLKATDGTTVKATHESSQSTETVNSNEKKMNQNTGSPAMKEASDEEQEDGTKIKAKNESKNEQEKVFSVEQVKGSKAGSTEHAPVHLQKSDSCEHGEKEDSKEDKKEDKKEDSKKDKKEDKKEDMEMAKSLGLVDDLWDASAPLAELQKSHIDMARRFESLEKSVETLINLSKSLTSVTSAQIGLTKSLAQAVDTYMDAPAAPKGRLNNVNVQTLQKNFGAGSNLPSVEEYMDVLQKGLSKLPSFHPDYNVGVEELALAACSGQISPKGYELFKNYSK